ncbi:MAG: hypothetical protein CMC93_02480 [Flavobacteriaceae bacterium]|nr:hypothetical protein [Flavobacteriaceae bacterium]|tara:strand:- start:764 stop:1207 length:444 start_codon:yes stop_codon:yes gene_type:complete
MNRIWIIILVLSVSNIFGQNSKMSFERLKALKMSYITEKIGLTEEEESVFWNVYDEYEKKIYLECRTEIKKIRRNYKKSLDSVPNSEAFEIIEKINNLEHYALKLKQERDKLLLNKFDAQKILKMHHAEYHFNREMVYKMKKERHSK